MISGLGCGYCEKALRDFKVFDETLVNVIVLEYGTSIKALKRHASHYSKYKFLSPETIECDAGKVNFFPIFYLYNSKEFIWNYKGYAHDLVDKIYAQTR